MTSTTRIALFMAVLALEANPANGFGSVKTQVKQPVSVSRKLLEERLESFNNPGKKRARLDSEEAEWFVPPPQPTENSESSTPKLPKGAVPQHAVIESKADLMEFLHEDDRLCVVKFHANWCKSCQKFGIHFDKLAARKADWLDKNTGDVLQRNEIRIASVEYTAAQALCEQMGITKLPTVLLFSNGRKVAEVSVGASKFSKVRDAVEQYSTFSSQDMDFAAKMEQGAALINSQMLTTPPKPMAAPVPQPAKETVAAEKCPETSSGPYVPAVYQRPAPRRKWWADHKKEEEESSI